MEPTVTIRNSSTGEIRQVPQSQLASYGVQAPQAPAPTPSPAPAPQGGGFASLLPLIGAIGGSFFGNPILGGAIGAGLGTIGKQAVSGQSFNPGEVAGEAGLAGAGGVGGSILSKILGHFLPGLLGKVGEGAIASQYNVPRNVARAINFPQSIRDLSQYGITDASKVPGIADQVTGANGIISQLTRQAVAKANPVDLAGYDTAVGAQPSVLEMAHSLATDPSITEGTANKFINFIDKGLQQSLGGDLGNITGKANPSEVFGLIQKLEKQAAGITRGRAPTAITAEDKTLANAYNSIADELRHRLFNVSGGNDAVAQGLLTPEQFSSLQAIHPQLAQDVANAKSVGDLRGIAAPFVQGNQAAAETAAGSQFGFQNLAGATKGIGKMVPTLANPLAPLTAGLSEPGVNGAIGGAALKASSALKGLNIPPNTLERLGISTGVGLGNPPTAQAQEPQTPEQQLASPQGQTIQAQDALRQRLGAYIISRARNVNDLVQGYNLLYPKPVQGQLSPQERNLLNSQLDQFAQSYQQMSPIQKLNPYDPTNRQLQTIRTTIIANLRKAIVAGRATQQELQWFMDLLPPLNRADAVFYPNATTKAAVSQLKTSLNLNSPSQYELPSPASPVNF